MPANIAITQDTTNPFSESDISINPNNLLQIIAGSNGNSAATSANQAQYWSNDGGATWHQTSLPAVGSDNLQGDPAVGWTSDGTAWALTLGVTITATTTTLVGRCFKSVDGGQNWTFDSVFSGTQTGVDKALLWVDQADNMYAVWHLGTQCFVARRAGPTGTWQAPQLISGAETTASADGGDIKTNSFGDVFVFWPDAGGQTLRMAKSTNHGVSFDALAGSPIQIASTFGSFTIKIPAQDARLAAGGVTLGC